jgi:hydroxyethylthiazole kinase-like uncharacterized protein yjeF
MVVLSPERMKRYDEYAINTWGIPGAVLMENAGRASYRLLKEEYLKAGTKLAIVCGRGNNGGDGYVIARYALRDGFEHVLLSCADPRELKGDAALNMELYRTMGGCVVVVNGADEARAGMHEADVIIDAIFGTGLSKQVEGLEKAVIEEMNASGRPIVAVDIPSGLDALRGVPLGAAVKAASTYTYGYAKVGQLLYPGASYVGALTVVDISLPPAAEQEIGIDGHVVDGDMFRRLLKVRAPWAHKGTFGHALVVSGSTGKTGAAAMTCDAALKVGAGLVTLVIPRSLNSIMEVKLTEAMTYPVEDSGKGRLTLEAFDEIAAFARDKDAIVIGPGLSTAEETMALVRKLFVELDKPFVVDADGITSFQGHLDLIKERKGNAVFTPHPGELGRLIRMSPADINADRRAVGCRFAETHGIDLVLKGARTLVCGADGSLYINPTGNASLAKGGSGDVLTGLIGGLVAQGYTVREAALLGVYLHGYIADTWVETHTDMDLVAGDLLKGIGEAMRDLRSGEDRVYIKKSL